jgi:hypothetical protein
LHQEWRIAWNKPRHVLGQQARINIIGPARSGADDDSDRLAAIKFRNGFLIEGGFSGLLCQEICAGEKFAKERE